MKLEDTVKEALTTERITIPPSTSVFDFKFELDEDSSGDDSIYVWAIMRDDVKPDNIPGEDVIQLKASIRSSLAKAGIDAFTYIYLVTAMEYAHEVDEV